MFVGDAMYRVPHMRIRHTNDSDAILIMWCN